MGDREDERMGGFDAKYTHLSTPRARSLLSDSLSLAQAEPKKLYKRTGLCYMFGIFCHFFVFRGIHIFLTDFLQLVFGCAVVETYCFNIHLAK